jgi:hypothetical protein
MGGVGFSECVKVARQNKNKIELTENQRRRLCPDIV